MDEILQVTGAKNFAAVVILTVPICSAQHCRIGIPYWSPIQLIVCLGAVESKCMCFIWVRTWLGLNTQLRPLAPHALYQFQYRHCRVARRAKVPGTFDGLVRQQALTKTQIPG